MRVAVCLVLLVSLPFLPLAHSGSVKVTGVKVLIPKGEITQLTFGSIGSRKPSVDGAGRRFVFIRAGAVFLEDLNLGVADTLVPSGADDVMISDAAKLVVLASSSDLVGGENADGSAEIFLHDVKTGALDQITHCAVGKDCTSPSIDKKGRWIAFLSPADIVAENPDENEEVFVHDRLGGTFTQITHTTAATPSGNPVVTLTGKHVLFDSDADPAGSNADGNREIFRYEIATGLTEQLTNTTACTCRRPFPSKNGMFVAFESDADGQLAGPNADGSTEIYLLKIPTGTFTRITSSTADAEQPSLSGNARYVAFESDGDLLVEGGNADRSREIFLARILSSGVELTQVTNGTAETRSFAADLNTSGSRLFFVSDADLAGGGSGVRQVFVYAR